MSPNIRRSVRLSLKTCCDEEEPSQPKCPCSCDKPAKSFLPILPNFLGFINKGAACNCDTGPNQADACVQFKEKQKTTPPVIPAEPPSSPKQKQPRVSAPSKPFNVDNICDWHRGVKKNKSEETKEAPKEKPITKLPSVLDVINRDAGCYCGIVATAMTQMNQHPLSDQPFCKIDSSKAKKL